MDFSRTIYAHIPSTVNHLIDSSQSDCYGQSIFIVRNSLRLYHRPSEKCLTFMIIFENVSKIICGFEQNLLCIIMDLKRSTWIYIFFSFFEFQYCCEFLFLLFISNLWYLSCFFAQKVILSLLLRLSRTCSSVKKFSYKRLIHYLVAQWNNFSRRQEIRLVLKMYSVCSEECIDHEITKQFAAIGQIFCHQCELCLISNDVPIL